MNLPLEELDSNSQLDAVSRTVAPLALNGHAVVQLNASRVAQLEHEPQSVAKPVSLHQQTSTFLDVAT